MLRCQDFSLAVSWSRMSHGSQPSFFWLTTRNMPKPRSNSWAHRKPQWVPCSGHSTSPLRLHPSAIQEVSKVLCWIEAWFCCIEVSGEFASVFKSFSYREEESECHVCSFYFGWPMAGLLQKYFLQVCFTQSKHLIWPKEARNPLLCTSFLFILK